MKQAAGTGDSAADQLSKLADLKAQGVLTDAEFEAQKAKILLLISKYLYRIPCGARTTVHGPPRWDVGLQANSDQDPKCRAGEWRTKILSPLRNVRLTGEVLVQVVHVDAVKAEIALFEHDGI